MSYETITTTVTDGVGVLQFACPERMNALNSTVFAECLLALEEFKRDDAVAVVVVTGGDTVFAAGLDLEELTHHNADEQDLYNESTYQFYRAFHEYPKPTIASISGQCIGGGTDIIQFCDIRVADESAIIAIPQIKFGFTTFIDPLWKIIGLGQAKKLLFTGDAIKAQEAKDIGLVDDLVPVGEREAATMKLAKRMARHGSKTLRTYKEQALRTPSMDATAGFVYAHALYRDVSRDDQVQANIRAMAEQMKSKA